MGWLVSKAARDARWERRWRLDLKRNQWPRTSIWGHKLSRDGTDEHPAVSIALDRWFAKHDCDGTCDGHCARYRRLTRLRSMYGSKR